MPINYYCDVKVQSDILTTDISESRVGVNTPAPATTLHANGVIRAGGTNAQSYVEIGDDSVYLYNSGVYRGSLNLYPNSSSGNLYITGANGTTVYFGAPTSWTTNISVQGQATLNIINQASSDTDKFLVSDGGTIKYRTGAEVRSDIGAGTGNGTVTGTGSGGRVAIWGTSSALTSDSEFYFDTTNNYLGIGAGSSPQAALHVKSTTTDDLVKIVGDTNGKPQINIFNGTTNTGRIVCTGSGAFDFQNLVSGTISFFNGGASRMTIASSGAISMGGNLTVSATTTTDNLNIGQNGTLDAENSSEILIGSSTEIQIDGNPGTSGQYIKSTGSAVEWGTLPDTTKTQTILFSNFLDSGSTTSALRMPFNTLVETTSNQYYNYFDVPASGTIKRVRMQNTSGTLSTGFTTTIVIWKNSAGGSPSYTSSAQTASGGEIEVNPNLSISKGDKVQIGYSKSAGSKYWQGVSATIVIEFTKV